MGNLTFREPDRKKYPSIELSYAAGRAGGTMTGVLSAANEQAVAMFLEEKISYMDITRVIEKTCDRHRAELVEAPRRGTGAADRGGRLAALRPAEVPPCSAVAAWRTSWATTSGRAASLRRRPREWPRLRRLVRLLLAWLSVEEARIICHRRGGCSCCGRVRGMMRSVVRGGGGARGGSSAHCG